MRFLFTKLGQTRVRQRVFIERLTEPLHLNLISPFVALFGTHERKAAYDLVLRPHNAYSLYEAVRRSRRFGLRQLTVVECGVASGAGLLNLCRIAEQVTRTTGVQFQIFGFDSGKGMPPPIDYRDHPELYWEGNYPMDPAKLAAALPANARLVLGSLSETIPEFVASLKPESPIGYVVLDVDYYSSTVDALHLLDGPPDCYLPTTLVFVDDMDLESHNAWCGARLAVREFNDARTLRKIEHDDFLVHRRIFKHPKWLSQMHQLHVLDHPLRNDLERRPHTLSIHNPYL